VKHDPIIIDGDLYLRSFDTSFFQPGGITIHVSGDAIVVGGDIKAIAEEKNYQWIDLERSTVPISDIIIFSGNKNGK
jgi:hypothetical protein